jgi:hypothetical protein
MILKEQEIKDIINKQPKKLRNSLTNQVINSYEYSLEEQLNLIQTYIYTVKGVDIGDIKPPQGNICPSFLDLAISKGIHPMQAFKKADDLHAAEFAMNIALKFFKDKYNEN